MYRKRFGLTGHPLPKNAQGKTFYEDSPAYRRLERAFRQLVDEPGVGLITGEPGVGKTAALRNLCATLPKPDHLVLYLCDTAVSPLDLYRTLAQELGVAPSHRRGQLWTDIKKVLVHMVDERHTQPVLVLDEGAAPERQVSARPVRLPQLRLRQPRAAHAVAGGVARPRAHARAATTRSARHAHPDPRAHRALLRP
ncbi:MAG: ATP-binding protein [Myxococcales bacterium]|nr:ATP-binding protein [Myxococcales bacterium]